MNNIEIEKFLTTKTSVDSSYVKISFKKRQPIFGLFLKETDYNELKAKNFWRIVTRKHFDEWNKSHDVSLAKIFHGSDFSKLASYQESFGDD